MRHHLVLIDLQRVFAEPGSPWAAPRFDQVRAPVSQLLAVAEPVATTWTRFVAPTRPTGAWAAYYEQWPFALTPPDDPQYDVVDSLGWTPDAVTLTATTFGKWGPDLAGRVGDAAVVLAGVSTDCCVLSTALAAADAGVPVLVVPDACAGSDDASHRRALDAMALYAPLITLAEVEQAAELLGAGPSVRT